MFFKYFITIKKQLNVLQYSILKYGLISGTYLYFFGFTIIYVEYLYVALFLFLFDILPAIYLHVQYLNNDKGVALEFNKETSEISIIKDTNIETYHLDDIQSVTIVYSYGYKGSLGWYSFGIYHFCEFKFKSGISKIFTCLMINDIENFLKYSIRKEIKNKFKLIAKI